MPWLLKTEPSTFSFADLQKSKTTRWDGIRNAAALKNMRAMKAGDQLLIYHTGDEKAVVGIATVVKAAYPDPTQDDQKLVVIDIEAGKPVKTPVTLAQIKADKRFADWDLVRISRLSVVPTSDAQWKAILELGGAEGR